MGLERRRVLLCKLSPRVPQNFVFDTWDLINKSGRVALSAGNLQANIGSTNATAWASFSETGLLKPATKGSVYWETKLNFGANSDCCAGLLRSDVPAPGRTIRFGNVIPDVQAVGIAKDGNCRYNGSTQNAAGVLTTGVIIRHLLDTDTMVYQQAVGSGAWYYALGLNLDGTPRALQAAAGASWQAAGQLFWSTGISSSMVLNSGMVAYAYSIPPGANPLYVSLPAPVVTPVYLASEKFNTIDTDVPPSQEWMARISRDTDLTTERDGSCWVWDAEPGVDRGGFTVLNKDGVLDDWITWEWRDALCEMFSGYAGDPISAFVPYSTDLVDTIEATDDKKYNFTLVSQLAYLDRNIQTILFPDDQANGQIAGNPLPIVVGQPLYCSGELLDPSTVARNYQLHDQFTDGTTLPYLSSISQIFDRGNLFAGPNDPYVLANGITSANGGSFSTWTGTPSVPANWAAVTAFGVGNDRFVDGGGGSLRCQSSGQQFTALGNTSVGMRNASRYLIAFTCTTVTIAGNIRFRVANEAMPDGVFDVVVNVNATGSYSVPIDTAPINNTHRLQILIGYLADGPVDVVIDNLTTTTTQIIDWTYYGDDTHRYGFHLANLPQGKIVANPIGPKIGSTVIEYLPEIVQMLQARTWGAYGEDPDWNILTSSATDLNTALTYRIAAYLDKSTTLLEFWNNLMDCYCGWVIQRRDGQIAVGYVREPDPAASVLNLDVTNCSSIKIYSDTASGLTLRMSGGKNNTVHDTSDLFSTINDPLSPLYNPNLSQALTSEYTITKTGAPTLTPGDNSPVSGIYAQSINAEPKETYLMDGSHIQAEINRIATLWRPQRFFIDVEALLNASDADELEPGDSVTLTWKYLKCLSVGQTFLVKRVRSSFFSRKVSLTLWGRLPLTF